MNLKRRIWSSGPALIVIAGFFFTVMGACVKGAAASLPLFEIVFFRSLVSLVVMGLILKQLGQRFRPHNFPLMSSRAVAGFLGVCCNFYGLSHLGLGDATVLLLTFPIFVALLSIFFLGEKPTRQLVILIALAWIGIALILKPQIQVLNFAGFVALLAALFSSFDIITINLLRRAEHPFLITFYLFALSTVASFPMMLQDYVSPTPTAWLFLLGAGLAGTIAQALISQAYGLDEASRLAPLSYISVIFSFMAGLLFWNEIPTWLSIVGVAVVIFCCVQVARLEKTGPALE